MRNGNGDDILTRRMTEDLATAIRPNIHYERPNYTIFVCEICISPLLHWARLKTAFVQNAKLPGPARPAGSHTICKDKIVVHYTTKYRLLTSFDVQYRVEAYMQMLETSQRERSLEHSIVAPQYINPKITGIQMTLQECLRSKHPMTRNKVLLTSSILVKTSHIVQNTECDWMLLLSRRRKTQPEPPG